MVKGAASQDRPHPDRVLGHPADGACTPPLDSYTLRLLSRQGNRSPICQIQVLTADQPAPAVPRASRER